jgi:hypothetical protein
VSRNEKMPDGKNNGRREEYILVVKIAGGYVESREKGTGIQG